MRNWRYATGVICSITSIFTMSANAQIIPDITLDSTITGIDSDTSRLIQGGTTSNNNVFHSFIDFNVNTGQTITFVPASNIKNILTRVTGNNISNINGILGVYGEANLFLLNPQDVISADCYFAADVGVIQSVAETSYQLSQTTLNLLQLAGVDISNFITATSSTNTQDLTGYNLN